jgi:hypothetical protein
LASFFIRNTKTLYRLDYDYIKGEIQKNEQYLYLDYIFSIWSLKIGYLVSSFGLETMIMTPITIMLALLLHDVGISFFSIANLTKRKRADTFQ